MILFLMPSYNEGVNLVRMITSLRACAAGLGVPFRILIVDDGSTDDTCAVLETIAGPDLLVQELGTNQGPGGAFREGFRRAIAETKDGDLVVTMEADNTGDLAILPEMMARAATHDLVLASCYAKGGEVRGTTWDRKVLSAVANTLMKTLFPVGASTYTSFYRLYRRDALARLTAGRDIPRQRGFTCMAEVLLRAAADGMTIAEVPMVLRCDARAGASKMKRTKTSLEYGGLILNNLHLSAAIWMRLMRRAFGARPAA